MSTFYQLKAILWKTWLQKWAHVSGFLAELFLPVLFMALLILIKTITSKYDSPNVAFYCGNTFPWFYTESIDKNVPITNQVPFVCTQKPSDCVVKNYYKDRYSYISPNMSISAYSQYGYTESSFAVSTSPFYSFTIGDESEVFEAIDNPSLPFCSILDRLNSNNAILGVCPDNGDDENLGIRALDLWGYLAVYCDNQTYPNIAKSVVYFSSQDELNSYVTSEDYDDTNYRFGKVAMAVVLNSADIETAQWDYSLRVNYTGRLNQGDDTVACLYNKCKFTYTIPSTKFYTADLFKPQIADNIYGYSFTGFSSLQKIVDAYIMSFYGKAQIDIRASVGMMPTDSFQSDDFQYIISSTLGIFYMLSFLYPVSRIIRALVVEKETRVKEGMKMMGLTDTVYNTSWLITTVLQMTIVSILITLVTARSVFEYSNKVLVFFYFETFSLSIIGMCFLLATLFSRSKTASLLGPMIFFGSFFPYYAVNDPQFSIPAKTATCLLAPACFALGANVFADYEGGMVGVQPANASQATSNFTYSLCVGMMFIDAVLYGVLAWYLDKVLPSEYGTSLPLYFPFLPSYWCNKRLTTRRRTLNRRQNLYQTFLSFFSSRAYGSVSQRESEENPDAPLDSNLLESSIEDAFVNSGPYFEAIAPDLNQQVRDQRSVSIRNLRKTFQNTAGGEDKVAVKRLNLDLFEGQVSVLLGHNGAGKTTTISMLVGMIPPTEGDAFMPGALSITEDMANVRSILGVCPQHDILFPELTVLQHLEIFAAFKGVPPANVHGEAQKILAEVGLREKANAKSATLSGGQKRKLSLGIALIGDSKVVILDEPTSGMDPFSRRSTWNIIQRNKKGRVILLTTHFMDEADMLGDRVSIMSEGELKCSGSPLFLKNRFGVGYTLTISKYVGAKATQDSVQATSSLIKDLVTKFIANAESLSDVGAEQSFRLPFSSSSSFVDLFKELDAKKESLNIAEYGISVTTLEEVFMRVGEMDHEHSADLAESNSQSPNGEDTGVALLSGVDDSSLKSTPFQKKDKEFFKSFASVEDRLLDGDEDSEDGTGGRDNKAFFLKHFYALLIKRAIYAKRDQRMIICQLILPVLLVVMGLCILLIRPNLSQPNLILSPSKYNPSYSEPMQNFVPMLSDSNCPYCAFVESRFNGNPDDGVFGLRMPVKAVDSDPFDSCSRGADALFNMSSYLISTPTADLNAEEGTSIYGTVTLGAGTNDTQLNYNILVNGSAVHGVGIYMNLVHQAYLQVISGITTASITTHNYPLPQTYKQQNQSNAIDSFVVALFCMIAFCFIPASFAVFLVKEREVKAKHQQVISGVSIYAYWLSTYVWDIVSYLPTALLVIAVLYAFSVDAYTQGQSAYVVVLLLLLYGPSTAAMTYLISFVFVSHSTAQVIVMFFNFITGLCLMIVSFVLTTIPSTSELNVSLRYLFRLFPSYCLGDGLAQMALCVGGNDCPLINKEGYVFTETQSPFSWDIAGGNLVFMTIEAIVYFAIAVAIEYGLTFPTLLSWLYRIDDSNVVDNSREDEDVKEERTRVARGSASSDIVRISELRKVYPANSRAGGLDPMNLACPSGVVKKEVKVAVQSLSFGIPKGECFGFLGINGAGKSTTLSILSGEFPPTRGAAFIDGYSIASDQSKIRRKIGYCPQFDALLELLTVREHLELYGRIKGLQGSTLESVVQRKMKQLSLTAFENRVAGSLSGGNKRKLSVAVATVGDPPIVFLDEPSTGMDPVARRFMWKVIAKMSTQDAQCSVILTTHSMEEAEALCGRIGVMVNGRLQCLGTAQHLKHRYGSGFEVNIKTEAPSEEALASFYSKIRHLCHPASVSASASASASSNNPLQQQNHSSSSSSSLDAAGPGSGSMLDSCAILQKDLSSVGRALRNPSRLQSIAPNGSGVVIHDSLSAEGKVSARLLADWWLGEDYFEAVQSFISTEFAGRAQLLERGTVHSCRYRIQRMLPTESHAGAVAAAAEQVPNALAELFGKFEAHKEEIHVQEYSVGQTTLEQIFNHFASQQDNPEMRQ